MRKNYSAWDIPFEDFFVQSSSRNRLAFLIRFAVLAPSSHNSQPWRLRVDDSHIVILPKDERRLSVSDPEDRHLFISLGCALENIVIAADYYGLDAVVDYFPETDPDSAARISFRELEKISAPDLSSSDRVDHLALAIPKRRVNRNPYLVKVPDESFLELIANLATDEVHLDVIRDQDKKDEVVDVLMASRLKAFSNSAFRSEMADYKRNNLTSSATGITGVTMGFSTPLSMIAAFLIRNFNVMKFIRKSEEELLSRYTPIFVLLSSKNNDKHDWIITGRILQRFMLEAERHGLQTAISAVPLNPIPLQKPFATEFRPQMFLRLGYAEKIPPHSPRLSAESVTEFAINDS